MKNLLLLHQGSIRKSYGIDYHQVLGSSYPLRKDDSYEIAREVLDLVRLSDR